MEGDTPSFLYLINNGLGNPEHPDWGSWGGRYELYTPRTQKWFLEPETRPIWSDAEDEVFGFDGHWHTSNHATDLALAHRLSERFRRAHGLDDQALRRGEPSAVPKLAHPDRITAKPGERVDLSAEGSTRSGRRRAFLRLVLLPRARHIRHVAGPHRRALEDRELRPSRRLVHRAHQSRLAAGNGTMHVILAVTDHGTPRLTRYLRVIVDVKP